MGVIVAKWFVWYFLIIEAKLSDLEAMKWKDRLIGTISVAVSQRKRDKIFILEIKQN